jgi:hypothetical protein
MSGIHRCCPIAAAAVLVAITAFPASAQLAGASVPLLRSIAGPHRADLYTTYSFWTGYTRLDMVVCGATSGSSGCYGSAQLGPFGHIGALIEGAPEALSRGVTTRNLYIVDEAAGEGTNVVLDVYQETVTVNSPDVTLSVTPTNTIALPLKGGTGANTYMAADNGYLFIGTDQSPFAVQVDKTNLSFGEIGGFSPPANVSSITTDDNGYVTVTFGNEGFYAYDPDGYFVEDGGGADYMLNSSNGLSTGTVSTSSMISKPRLKVRLTHVPSRAASGS